MPSVQMLHVDRLLTGYSRAWRQPGAFVGTLLLPFAPVPDIAGYYDVYTKEDVFEIVDDTHGWDDEAEEISWSKTTDTYACLPYALKTSLSYYKLKASTDPNKTRMRSVDRVKTQLYRNLEYKVSTLMTTVTTYPVANRFALAGDDCWDSGKPGATPIQDIDKAIHACELEANTLLIGKPVWDVLKRDATLIDAIKYTSPGIVTPQLVATYFEIPNLIIGAAKYKHPTTGLYTYFWGDNVIASHTEPMVEDSIQLGCVFTVGAQDEVRTWYDPARGRGSEMVEVNWCYSIKVLANECGAIISNCLT